MPSTDPTQNPTMTRFYLPKGRISFLQNDQPMPILAALLELQKRKDLSGKFARKLNRERRIFAPINEGIVEDSQTEQERFKKKDAKGDVIPVVVQNALGQVQFRKDGNGQDTDEPLIREGEFYLTDRQAYDKAIAAFAKEIVVVDCEPFTEAEIDAFKNVDGQIIDALSDLLPDSPYTKAPEANATDTDDDQPEPAENTVLADEAVDKEERTAP